MTHHELNAATREPAWLRRCLIGAAIAFFALFIALPLGAIFYEALRRGLGVYVEALSHADALAAVRLSLLVTFIALPLNIVFGLAAAWCITKFEFRGKSLLVSLIDLPFSISPVVVGLMFLLLFGVESAIGAKLAEHDIQLLFALPAIIIATLFVTVPFVARELIALMSAQGREEEEAAIVLGARGWQVFWYITLPNVRWALLYGAILSNARALGEFGAVSVVSGHIRGQTTTLPLHVEILYNEYNFAAAFAAASVLALLALLTLALKALVERRAEQQSASAPMENFTLESSHQLQLKPL